MGLIAIASAIVIWEYRRSALKDEAKAEALEKEKEEVRNTITNLEFTVERQSVQIKELTRLTIAIRDDIHKLNTQAKKGGWFGKGGDKEADTVPAIPEALQFDHNDQAEKLKPQNVSCHEQHTINAGSEAIGTSFCLADTTLLPSGCCVQSN